MKTVQLTDDSTGELLAGESDKIGDTVTLAARDENGLPIEIKGVLAEILIDD